MQPINSVFLYVCCIVDCVKTNAIFLYSRVIGTRTLTLYTKYLGVVEFMLTISSTTIATHFATHCNKFFYCIKTWFNLMLSKYICIANCLIKRMNMLVLSVFSCALRLVSLVLSIDSNFLPSCFLFLFIFVLTIENHVLIFKIKFLDIQKFKSSIF